LIIGEKGSNLKILEAKAYMHEKKYVTIRASLGISEKIICIKSMIE